MSRSPSLDDDTIQDQLEELDSLLDDSITAYLIGGGVLTLQEMKPATKDIDLVVETEPAIEQLRDSLLAAGYEPPADLSAEYEQLQAAFILQEGISRFDVFRRSVAGVIVLSEGMKERSEPLFDGDSLTVRQVSLEDIFLFKSVANRPDDVDDMITIAQAGLDDDTVLDEIDAQLDLVGTDHFIDSMKQKLDRVADRGYPLDIIDDVGQLYERAHAGERVYQIAAGLLDTEYQDDLYEGVPVQRVRQRYSGDVALADAIDWLERLERLDRGTDETLVIDVEWSQLPSSGS